MINFVAGLICLCYPEKNYRFMSSASNYIYDLKVSVTTSFSENIQPVRHSVQR